jgi:SAM-dependent methyltransferase
MSDIERQRNHFTSVAQRYIDARKSKNHLLLKSLIWRYLFSLKSVQNIFKNQASISTFEPMCGYGEGYKILKEYGSFSFIYEGADISEPMIKEALSRYPHLKFSVGDATKDFGTNKYDLIIVIGGLHHVFRYLPLVLENIHCALRPGGIFINFEPTEGNRLFTYVRNVIYRNNDLFDADTERGFGLGELNNFYQSAGFNIVEQIYPGLSSYVLYYNPDAFPKLNNGPNWFVSILFNLDKFLFRNYIGGFLSFATISVLRKNEV